MAVVFLLEVGVEGGVGKVVLAAATDVNALLVVGQDLLPPAGSFRQRYFLALILQ